MTQVDSIATILALVCFAPFIAVHPDVAIIFTLPSTPTLAERARRWQYVVVHGINQPFRFREKESLNPLVLNLVDFHKLHIRQDTTVAGRKRSCVACENLDLHFVNRESQILHHNAVGVELDCDIKTTLMPDREIGLEHLPSVFPLLLHSVLIENWVFMFL